jgi:hypothetical protein
MTLMGSSLKKFCSGCGDTMVMAAGRACVAAPGRDGGPLELEFEFEAPGDAGAEDPFSDDLPAVMIFSAPGTA